MVCDTCQHDNQPNAKFCSECGAPLARPCPSCGRRQSSTAKFCDECGTALTAPPPPSPALVPAPTRKRVTALFADLVGSTAFAERLDAEAVRAGLAPYFELLQSTIDDHAGSVVKFLGDGVFALFGVPEVAEDDALRAVTAGIELQRRFRCFADEIGDRHGVELGLRVGVNTGELVVGADDVDLVGDVLNTAARLEAACEPGHVLVGEHTWRVTRSNVPYEALGDVRVKGKTEPVAAFQVVDHDIIGADELTPFVGRSSELDALRGVFHDAVGGSAARLATVIGDPGVGKTRLAQELRAGSEARSFDLRLERRGSMTFAPIADLLREVTGSGSAEDIDRLVDGQPEAARLGSVLASFLGHGAPSTTEESFWAVRRLLELLAVDGPVIVVVDDIQWAEPLFWDLLEHLVEWTAAPVLLIALARPELRELRPELTQPGRRVSATIALEGLDPDTTLELAARLLGIDELPPELAERLPQSTDGNPLFVRELVQMLVDDGVLARDGDRWRLTIDADAIEVPPTILSLLASRVERLPDEERQVVELASVIGTEFDRGMLAAIATGEVATRLGAVVDRLRRKDLIEPTGQWAGDHPVYRFHHVLIRDAAYRRLLKGHRAELHERVGRHVETTGIADDERDVIVAHHFEQVYQYRSDLGTVDDHTRDLADEAATRLRSAAEQALGREDLASAGGAAIRALRLLGAGAGTERDELLLIGCEALLASADVTRSARLVDELHTRSADARLSAWADCFRAQLWSLTAAERLTEAGELAADAADRLTAIGDDAGVAKARLVRASCLARLGRVGDCEAELDLALGAARAAGDRRRTVAVLGAAPLAALWGPSPVARAGGRCLDVLRLLRITTPSPTVEATSIRCQGMLEALRCRDDAARAKFETSRAMARELGLRHALYETELFAGLAELLVGDAIAAEPHLRAAHDGLGRLGIGADAGQAAALLARSLLLQGRVAEADELATAALDTAGQNLQTAIAARAVLAEVRATQGNHDDARLLVDEALSIVAPTDVTLDHALTLLAAARVATAAGNHVEASRRQTQANELLASKGVSLRFDAARDPVPAGGHPSDVDSARSEPSRRFTNTAWEISQLGDEAFARRDADALRSLLAPGFHAVWHERLAPAPLEADRETFVDALFDVDGRSDPVEHQVRLLALRGDHLALTWNRVVVGGAEPDVRYRVNESAGRHIVGVEWFDHDQLDAAIAELDRRWLTTCGVPSDAVAVRAWPTSSSLHPADIAEFAHPDFEYTDHYRLRTQPDVISFDELIGYSHDGWVEAETWALVTNVHRFDESGAVYERVEYNDGNEIPMVWVAQEADGAIRRLDRFDHDNLDAAIALFDSRRLGRVSIQKRELTNAAARFAGSSEELLAIVEADDGQTRRATIIAVRGDHLCLVHEVVTSGDGVGADHYFLVASDDHGITSIDWFDDDHLDEAVAELDLRYLLSQGFAADHWIVTAWSRTYGTTADALLPYLHPDVEFVEHRPFHQLSGGAEALLRSADAPNRGTAMVTQVLRVTERGALFERVETEPGAPGEAQMLMVLGFTDERVRHLEVFEADALDTAMARYDELTGGTTVPRELGNTASRLATAFTDAQIEQDADRVAALMSPEFTIRAHGRWAEWFPQISGPEFLTVLQPGEGSRIIDVVAIRGEHLCLIRRTRRLPSGLETDARHFLVASDDQRIISLDWYQDGQEEEGYAELDRQYRQTCGIGDDHWIARNWEALTSFDADRYEVILSAGFTSVDHRSVTLGQARRDEFLGWLRATPASSSWSIPAIHRLSDRGIVLEHVETWADGVGRSRMLVVVELANDLARRMDAYEPDDLFAALARYDEITGASRRPLTNDAWESAVRRQDAQSRQDRAGFAAMFDTGFVAVFHDPRTTAVHGTAQFDSPRFMELVLHPDMTSEGGGSEMELIAVRGDDLCLYRVGMISSDGDLTERLIVDATHDGRCTRMDIFDPGQLIDAQLELDRWYRKACGIGDDHWLAAAASTPYTTDFASLQWFLHPDFEYVERRPLAWPSGEAGHLREYMATYRAVPELIISTVYRLSEHGVVYERLETADDHAVTDVVMVCHFQDERLRRLIAYEPEDLDRALAEFDAFVARRSGQTLTNNAWAVVRRAEAMRREGDRDGYASLLADGFAAVTHDPIMVAIDDDHGAYDKEQYLDALFDPIVFGPTSTSELDLIAVRGVEFCLFRVITTTLDGDTHERIVVVEVRDGFCVRMEVFEPGQLAKAFAEIDRLYRRACGIEDDHWITAHWRVMYSADFADIAPVLHPEFEFVERRRLAWPNGNLDDWREWMAPGHVALESTVPAMHRLSEHGVVTLRSERFEAGDLGVIEVVLVNEVEDGRVRRVISYAPEDLDQALAEFDAFVARREAGEPLTNGAWEVAQDALLAHRGGDRERFSSFLTDDFLATAHDSIMASVDADGGVYDRALFVEASFDPLLYGPSSTSDVGLIAVRGDDYCLFRIRTTSPDGDLNERIHLLEVRDGLGVRWDSYRDDQLAEAQIALDHRWVASLGFPDDHPWFAVIDWFYESDPTVVACELSDDFRSIEHRRLTYPDGDRSQMIANMNTRLDAIEVVVPRYLRVTDRMALFELVEQTVGGSEQSPSLIVSQLGPDGRVAHLEIFEVDDADAAIACFDRLLAHAEPVTSPGPAIPPLTNRAWEIVSAFNAAYLAGNRDAIERVVDPDGPVDYHLRLSVVGSDTARGFVDLVLASHAEAGENRQHLDLVAVRGDHHCLALVDGWYDDANLRYCLVVETDEERVTNMVWFDDDQLIAAQLELDRRWLAGIGYADHWFEPLRLLLYDPRPDAMFEHLTPDFEYIDHRPLMFPSGDAEVLRSNIHSMQHEVVFTIPRIHRISDAGSVLERVETAVGEIGHHHIVFVSQFVDQRVQRMEAFDITQFDQALARYDEFTTGQGQRIE